MFYAVAVLSLLAGRFFHALKVPARWASGGLLSLCCVGASALGAAPMLVYNLQHRAETLSFLLQRGAGTGLQPWTIISRALFWSGPVLLGLVPPTTDRQYLYRYLLGHWLLYGAALVLLLMVAALGALRWRGLLARLGTILDPSPAPDIALLTLTVFLLAGFFTSSWGATQWSETQPRYLLPLYTATPVAVRLLVPRTIRAYTWVPVVAAVAAIIAGVLYVNTTTFSRQDLRPLASLLEKRGVLAVYGDYWTVYPLMFDSRERIAGAAVNDDLTRGYNRRLSYVQRAAASDHFAWIVTAGSARQQSVLACLRARHSVYTIVQWRDQLIYDAPTGRAFPYWNGGSCKAVLQASHSL